LIFPARWNRAPAKEAFHIVTGAAGERRIQVEDCLFCKIAAGEIPSDKLYEDERVLAFYDIHPQAPVHFLVIPKEHIHGADEITVENSGTVAYIYEVIARLCAERGVASFRVVTNCGEDAGQSVPHLHFHVLGGRELGWPPG